MAKAYVRTFQFETANGLMTMGTVVMDKSEFDALVDEIFNTDLEITLVSEDRNNMADTVRKACHIPLISRGAKTEFLFERYGIECDSMSVIVRGHGVEVVKKLGAIPDPEAN